MKVFNVELHLPCSFLRDVGKITHKSDQINLLEAHFLVCVFTDHILRTLWVEARDVVVLVSIVWIRKDIVVVDSCELGHIRFLALILELCKARESFFTKL